jgi:zinc transport system ATP-binding protein
MGGQGAATAVADATFNSGSQTIGQPAEQLAFRVYAHIFCSQREGENLHIAHTGLTGLQGRRGFRSPYTREDREKAMALLASSGIAETARQPIGEVSGGQMQRALLARAVISDPKLLILDEPANFVDNKFEKELYRTLHELNTHMAIVMVSHDIGTITSVVKEIVCVNRRVHRHRSNVLTEEQLRNYDCPIQLVSHGHIPHTVLEHHPGDGCCDHDSVR